MGLIGTLTVHDSSKAQMNIRYNWALERPFIRIFDNEGRQKSFEAGLEDMG